uniref:Sporulation domain-containing protein n=1 Tax=Candidatus Nitrotoga fabula TaxID=2182327 RepID=A0A2X0SPJ9_9PROT|nr:Sporulation domain-containing protein [Candidatus Nitrotoga fabula]
MSKYSNTRSAPSRRGSSLLTGILVGMVAGLLIAGGVAWYILKTPSAFIENVTNGKSKLVADAPVKTGQEGGSPSNSGSNEGEGKPRFEFYKVLTDTQDVSVPIPKNIESPAVQQRSQPVQAAGQAPEKEMYLLQVGSFPNAVDADNLKARLAMLGLEASVQVAEVPDKGVWHRVHMGPYASREEVKNVQLILKQNGISATPILAR